MAEATATKEPAGQTGQYQGLPAIIVAAMAVALIPLMVIYTWRQLNQSIVTASGTGVGG
jgi:hypothetical protein